MTLKRLLKWMMAVCFYYSGFLFLFERFSRYSKNSWWILEYHRVSDAKDDIFKMVVPTRHFQKQMRYLKKKYNILSLEGAVEKLKVHRSLPPRTLTITFDDGYQDVYLNAYPVLKQLGISATIFLVTDYIGTRELLWFDELLELVKASSVKQLSIQTELGNEFFNFSHPGSKTEFILRLLDIVKQIKPEEKKKYLLELKNLLEVKEIKRNEKILLNWQEIEEMGNNGIEIGSHGKTHTILTVLNSAELEAECRESKETIERIVKKPVVSFSYPNGRENDFNDYTVTQLYKSGYKAACVNILGDNRERIDLFKLKRRGIELESSRTFFGMYSRALFACEVSGIFDLFFLRKDREDVC